MSRFNQTFKGKSIEIFWIFFLTFVPMWSIFLVNHYIFQESLNIFGIHPRNINFASLIEINTSWLLHAGYDHIVGNTMVLFPLLLLLCIFEKKATKTFCLLIFTSGLFTWILGSSSSVHVGASGLIFALSGYIISSLVLGRKFLYIIPVGIIGYYYSQSLFHGLIPQEHVSFAAHFGGFISGIILGYFLNKNPDDSSFVYKKTLKEKFSSLVWDIKYRLKK